MGVKKMFKTQLSFNVKNLNVGILHFRIIGIYNFAKVLTHPVEKAPLDAIPEEDTKTSSDNLNSQRKTEKEEAMNAFDRFISRWEPKRRH